MRYSNGFNLDWSFKAKAVKKSTEKKEKHYPNVKKGLENDTLIHIISHVDTGLQHSIKVSQPLNLLKESQEATANSKQKSYHKRHVKTFSKLRSMKDTGNVSFINTDPVNTDGKVGTDTSIGIIFAVAGLLSVILAFIFAVYFPVFIFTIIFGATGLLFSILGLSGVTQDDTKAIIRGVVAVLLSIATLLGSLLMAGAYLATQ